MPQLPLRRSPRHGHLVVCGDSPLAFRLVKELTRRFDESVTVIVSPMARSDRRRNSALKDAHVVEAAAIDEQALRAANVESARAIAIVNQDDVGNLHIALRARELNQQIRLVIHFFNRRLGRKLSNLFGDCVSLSDSEVAAPSFVAGALDHRMTHNYIRVLGRTLYAARRTDVRRGRMICALADNVDSERPDMLPEEQDDADLVLAVADGRQAKLGALRRRLSTGMLQLSTLVSGRLRFALFLMLTLLVLGTVLFALDDNYTIWDAIYLTLLDVAGATDPDRELSKLTKLTQVLVTVVGISIIPLLTAAVVDAVVSSRINPFSTRRPLPFHGHVVVVGLGNVGTRVIRRLHDLGRPVVCVESSEDAPGVPVARSKKRRIPVIVGDSTREETLRAAGVDHCRALLAVTSDDVTNLETGLEARELRQDLRLVLRIGDDDLAGRLQREFDIGVSRSVSHLAAPAFAAAMLQREVLGTLAVGRRVLLIAEVPIKAGSPLLGYRVADVHEAGTSRVMALRHRDDEQVDWSPQADRVLDEGDQLIVVATRTGLGQILASSVSEDQAVVGQG